MIFDAEDASGLGGESVKGGGLEPPFAFNNPPAGDKPAGNLAFLAGLRRCLTLVRQRLCSAYCYGISSKTGPLSGKVSK